MLNSATKKIIDDLHDILVGKVPNPISRVDLITTTLIYKFMWDMDSESVELGGNARYFTGEFEKYRWDYILAPSLSGPDRVLLYTEALTKLQLNPALPALFRQIFKNSYLPFNDPATLYTFLKIAGEVTYDHSEKLGDAFEYMLSSLDSAGDAGMFRTPRNIIDFMVRIIDPRKGETILDPACGTAGFLVSAYRYIMKENTKDIWGDLLTPAEASELKNNIIGYDISPDMVKLSLVNLFLHNFPEPNILEYDTLTYDTHWDDRFDIIMANPPFMTPKGGIKPHGRFSVVSNRSEVLFVDYIAEHLEVHGRAAVIVPEGIIFQTGGAYVKLRKLITETSLAGVISLPAGIFQPYSGVKTSILLLNKPHVRRTDRVIMVKIENDGFSLNANRTPVKDNDLPSAEKLIRSILESPESFDPGEQSDQGVKYRIVTRTQIAALDSYKAVTTAAEFMQKQFKELDKAKSKNPLLSPGAVKRFLSITGLPSLPESESEIKSLITPELKEALTEYGTHGHGPLEKYEDLCSYLDSARDYNLSMDRYFQDADDDGGKSKWEMVRLGDVCEIIAGQSPDSQFYSNTEIGLPFYQGKTEYGDIYLKSPKVWTTYSTKISIKDDILFSMRAPVGAVNINPFQEICIGRGLAAIRVSSNIVMKYLFYVLRYGEEENSKAGSTGSVFDSITKSQLQSIQIPLPPLEEQEKIVAEIEGYQKVIDGCNLVIDNYKPTFKIDPSWEKVRLGEVCEIVRDSWLPDMTDTNLTNYIGLENISANTGYLIGNIIVTKNSIKSNKTIFRQDDILFGRLRPNLNKVLLADCEGICSTDILVLRVNKNLVEPYFLSTVMRQSSFNLELLKFVKGAQLPRISADDLFSVAVLIPKLQVQKSLVEELKKDLQVLAEINSICIKYQKKINELFESFFL